MDKVIEAVVGRKFNNYTVLSFSHYQYYSTRSMQRIYNCRCECGNERKMSQSNLAKTTHCSVCRRTYNVSHKSTHPLYRTWCKMIQRCINDEIRGYKDYGGRGITVCHRWMESFDNFANDMGKKPSPEHSLDRIDPNGNYEPSNCRWATRKEQANNTRLSHLLTKANVARQVGCSPEYIRQITKPYLQSFIIGYHSQRSPIFKPSVVPFLKSIIRPAKLSDRIKQLRT